MKRILSVFLYFNLVLFSLFPGSSSSQDAPLGAEIEHYPSSDYQGHGQVFCVDIDPYGGIWFGSGYHLFHHNGTSWEKYLTRKGNLVAGLDIDRKGRIWVGGQGAFGYMKMLAPGDSGSSMETKKSSRNPGLRARLEFVDLSKGLPEAHRKFGLVWNVYAVLPKDKGAEAERVVFQSHESLFIKRPSDILTIYPHVTFHRSYRVGDRIWVSEQNGGLYELPLPLSSSELERDSSMEKAAYKLPESYRLGGWDKLSPFSVSAIYKEVPGITEKGEVLLVTRRNGLYRYKPDKKLDEGEKRLISVGPSDGSLGDIYQGTQLDPAKNAWGSPLLLNTVDKGAVLTDRQGKRCYRADQKEGMPTSFLWDSRVGANGTGVIWSGTNKGIVKFRLGGPLTYAREKDGLRGVVQGIEEMNGRLWAASTDGLYRREQSEENGWVPIPDCRGTCTDMIRAGEALYLAKENLIEVRQEGDYLLVDTVLEENPYLLTKAPEREVFVSAGRGGVAFLRPAKGGGVHKELLILDPVENPSQLLLKDGEKGMELWMGLKTKGFMRIEVPDSLLKGGGSFKKLSFQDLRKDHSHGISVEHVQASFFPEGPVRVFSFDRKNEEITLGTNEGLYRPMEEEGSDTLRVVPDHRLGERFAGPAAAEQEEGTHQAPQIFQLIPGADPGKVWVQNTDRVYRFHHKEGEIQKVDSTVFRSLDLGTVRTIHPDSNGITWMGGDRGIVRYDEGVEADLEKKFPCQIRKVRVVLPDTGGRKEKKRDSLLFMGFYTKGAKKEGVEVRERTASPSREAPLHTLPYSMNSLKFSFSAIFYRDPEDLSFRYRLKGFEERWSPWRSKTQKEYTSLEEGSYVFKVQARNVYGIKSRTAEFPFVIEPPWYRTWSAYGAFSVAGLGFLWLLVFLNSQRLRAQKEHLEKVVDDRTHQIRKEQEETQRRKEEVEQAHQQLFEAHQEITQSIDYAQKIQDALLRSENEAAEHLPEHFVLFKPQAKVSGDFYWFKEHRGYLYVAAVDCTGHGVPGAFMSMLGISQLNEIMSTDEAPTPGAVLTELRERVVRELSGSEPGETAKDGMDAAMVKIPVSNPKSQGQNPKEIEFAGAQNPLYVVRKGIADEALAGFQTLPGLNSDRLKPFKRSPDGIEVKGDSMPVGYDEYASGDFSTISLEVQKGDMLYTFSDGYADQFGGPKGKKFRYGPFKQLLASLHEKPVEEQKRELDRTFEEWKAESGQEQIDDVVVVGIRV